ncbi:uncharacterized protein KY384_007248 [Bacidia gigantensis]|uniref:uncharacterized protein n=1 Tax=Bacidia gigantensis TaxID=2732470 RepID=UPI001D0599F5|nr:uncharacterized protein KY384_007248 [Bacidia gigantensis]KAG8528330.1 hypothetical protein KY384_007248 [Bacidia gigantensis]
MTSNGPSGGQSLQYLSKQAVEIWDSLWKNNLWKRILKNVFCTTTLVAIALIHVDAYGRHTPIRGDSHLLGRAGYLGAITTVFGHPGRRFGQMTEALILAVSGAAVGVAWSTFGLYLGSLVIHENPEAGFAIRAIFYAITALAHGFLRSKYPRLFLFALLLIIASTSTLLSTSKGVTAIGVTQILYPILIAVGIILVINICIFPEFSASFLGKTTIETLSETSKALQHAGHYFIAQNQQDLVVNFAEEQTLDDGSASDSAQINKPKHSRVLSVVSRLFSKTRHRVQGKASLHYKESKSATANHVKSNNEILNVQSLTAAKGKIRNKQKGCKAAQQECNFELAWGVLPPGQMKPISSQIMKHLVGSTIAVINACESKFALVGEKLDSTESTGDEELEKQPSSKLVNTSLEEQETNNTNEENGQALEVTAENQFVKDLGTLKPKREIESADPSLLRFLITAISKPYLDLSKVLDEKITIVSTCTAYCYNVPELPTGLACPKSITVGEIDKHIENLQIAMLQFDNSCASALEGANALGGLRDREPDIMPREEIFLISSFMLNFRQAGSHIEDMLKHGRDLVSQFNNRHGRPRFYLPRIKWSKWLFSGEEDEALPNSGRQSTRRGEKEVRKTKSRTEDTTTDIEPLIGRDRDLERNAGLKTKRKQATSSAIKEKGSSTAFRSTMMSTLSRIRGRLADALEWAQDSEDLLYAFKLAFGIMLVTWPGFVASWNQWYSLNRGLWAALQLVFVLEVSIGTSITTAILRSIGTTLGCLWGWALVEARGGNKIVCTIMICIGIIPYVYVQVGTKYPKGGMVGIISVCIVALSDELHTVPGTNKENFLRRWLAFLIGAAVAVLVEIFIVPVKARDRLVEAIAASLTHISEMEQCIAIGIDEGKKIDIVAAGTLKRFEKATGKANSSLGAAETICLALIYNEMIFVLHEIVDRMENMIYLRFKYGSGPLEEYNTQLYQYRRNVAGAITLTLSSIQFALLTKLPLPQFLPSARLAHLRMINRVREVVLESIRSRPDPDSVTTHPTSPQPLSTLEHPPNPPQLPTYPDPNSTPSPAPGESKKDKEEAKTANLLRQSAVRRKYLSWNASSAAQAEIIEFLEELVELAKLVVGAMEFRGGLLSRDLLSVKHHAGPRGGRGDGDPLARVSSKKGEAGEVFSPGSLGIGGDGADTEDKGKEKAGGEGTGQLGNTATKSSDPVRQRRQGRVTSGASRGSVGEGEVPNALRRIQTRKMEAGLHRSR